MIRDLAAVVREAMQFFGGNEGGILILLALTILLVVLGYSCVRYIFYRIDLCEQLRKQCLEENAAIQKENRQLGSAVDGLYDVLTIITEPMGYRLLSLDLIKRGQRPVVVSGRRSGDKPQPPLPCDRTL